MKGAGVYTAVGRKPASVSGDRRPGKRLADRGEPEMPFHVNRRQFLAGCSATLALGLPRPALSQKQRLRMIFWGSQARAERTYAAADLYMKANPGTGIDGEFLGWNDYWAKLATQIAGGNAPDIIQMDYRYIVEYASRGAIAPLDSFVGTALNLADFDPLQVDSGKVDGKLYGVSLGSNSVAMMVNKAVFERLKLPVLGSKTTWDDFSKLAADITKARIRRGFYGAADGSRNEQIFENYLRQRGKALYTAEGQIAFDVADVAEWFDMWARLRDAGAVPPADIQELDQLNIDTSLLSQSKVAVAYANSNELVGYQKLNKDPLALANFPRLTAGSKGGHYRKPAMLFSVFAKSPNQKAAAEFISYFVNDLEAAKALGTERGIQESAKVRAALSGTLDEVGRTMLTYVSDLGDLAAKLPPSPPTAAGEVQIAFQHIASSVAFGQQRSSEAARTFVADAAKILKRKT